MSVSIKRVSLSTGVTLPYAEQGSADGVPMLLLHGYTDCWRSFESVLPHLPAPIHAFAPTQRGHGDATRPERYRTRDFAADALAFMDALGLERAIIAGHSMGATNAQRFAIDHPQRVLGLVLAGSFPSYRANPVVREFWEAGVALLSDPIDPAFVREFQVGTLAQAVPEAFIDMAVRESLKVPARVWRAAFEGFLEDACVGELDRIEAPTVILWGDQDGLCSRQDQNALLSAIAGSRLRVYEGAGHALHWEEPQRFAADLAAFAEECRAVA